MGGEPGSRVGVHGASRLTRPPARSLQPPAWLSPSIRGAELPVSTHLTRLLVTGLGCGPRPGPSVSRSAGGLASPGPDGAVGLQGRRSRPPPVLPGQPVCSRPRLGSVGACTSRRPGGGQPSGWVSRGLGALVRHRYL